MMEKLYKNISYLFILVLLLVLAGFFKTYFGLFPGFKDVTSLIHFHALTAILWLLMLIIQPVLIRSGLVGWHRMVGKGSYILVPLVIISMAMVMRVNLQRESPAFIGIADMVFFGMCYALAIYHKRKTPYHLRYMVMTVLPFINPAAGRLHLPGPVFGLLIIIGLIIYERFNHRHYKPYLVALFVFFIIYPVALFIIDIKWLHSVFGNI